MPTIQRTFTNAVSDEIRTRILSTLSQRGFAIEILSSNLTEQIYGIHHPELGEDAIRLTIDLLEDFNNQILLYYSSMTIGIDWASGSDSLVGSRLDDTTIVAASGDYVRSFAYTDEGEEAYPVYYNNLLINPVGESNYSTAYSIEDCLSDSTGEQHVDQETPALTTSNEKTRLARILTRKRV